MFWRWRNVKAFSQSLACESVWCQSLVCLVYVKAVFWTRAVELECNRFISFSGFFLFTVDYWGHVWHDAFCNSNLYLKTDGKGAREWEIFKRISTWWHCACWRVFSFETRTQILAFVTCSSISLWIDITGFIFLGCW